MGAPPGLLGISHSMRMWRERQEANLSHPMKDVTPPEPTPAALPAPAAPQPEGEA